MTNFKTSLLREKFVLEDEDKKPIVALSNRMVITLINTNVDTREVYVVRTQNMHSCVRLTSRILREYRTQGPIQNRPIPFNWSQAWEMIAREYELEFNPDIWIAVYHKGEIIFEFGKHHAFLDVIEKCAAQDPEEYESHFPFIEKTFEQSGKSITLNHESNYAMVSQFSETKGRCNIILRSADNPRTFSFAVESHDEDEIDPARCLGATAGFLEGIQLAFMVGMNEEKIEMKLIETGSDEEKQTRAARKRLAQLSSEINNLEDSVVVRYRPERPSFKEIMENAKAAARKNFKPD